MAKGDKQVYKLALTSFWSWDDGCIKTMEQLVREKKGETFFNKSINMILADTPRTMERLHWYGWNAIMSSNVKTTYSVSHRGSKNQMKKPQFLRNLLKLHANIKRILVGKMKLIFSALFLKSGFYLIKKEMTPAYNLNNYIWNRWKSWAASKSSRASLLLASHI